MNTRPFHYIILLLAMTSVHCRLYSAEEIYIGFVLSEQLIPEGNGTKIFLVTKANDLEPIYVYFHVRRGKSEWMDSYGVADHFKKDFWIPEGADKIDLKKTLLIVDGSRFEVTIKAVAYGPSLVISKDGTLEDGAMIHGQKDLKYDIIEQSTDRGKSTVGIIQFDKLEWIPRSHATWELIDQKFLKSVSLPISIPVP